ncbi:MAG: hypothetical protein ACRDTD_15735, partial [Pseudonocardiaceae bacterium]
RLTVDALVVSLLPGDNIGSAISQKDLDLLKKVAPKQLEVPQTMNEVKSENPSSPSSPASPAEPGIPTVGDLANTLKALNPNLMPKGDGDHDALLEIVVSSASCSEERKKEEPPAPAPKPVEAELPVTH